MPTQVDPSSIACQGAAKEYARGSSALAPLDLAVAPGEFVSIIGPSGCGKSTLLRMISGLIQVSSGSILVDGLPPSRARGRMAFIFQDPTLLPWLTVRGNLSLPLHLRGISSQERRVRVQRMLQMVRLEGFERKYPRELSGGMRMRVSVARALALRPSLLLLDEPFGSVDEITRHHLNEELLELYRQQGWTALLVTHSVAEAVFLSQRVLVFGDVPGRLWDDIKIELPTPRTEATRSSAEYFRWVSQVGASLGEAERQGSRTLAAGGRAQP